MALYYLDGLFVKLLPLAYNALVRDGAAGGTMTTSTGRPEKLFTVNFLLICFATFLTFEAFFLLWPTLPIYVLQLGGGEAEVGMVLGAVAISAVLFRPLVGVQSDRHGRLSILLAGQLGILAIMILLNFMTSIPALVVLRLVHGIAWAASTTVLQTLIVDVAPPSRRGEAVGYFGTGSHLAMATAPALGIAIVNSYSFATLFLTSSAFALVGLLAVLRITHRTSPRGGHFHSTPVSQPSGTTRVSVLPVAFIFLLATGFSVLISFLPLYAKGFQVDNPGLFFTTYAVVVLLSRPLSGKLSDLYGRAAVIVPGIALMVISLVLLSLSGELPMLLVVGLMFGLGFGANNSALNAMAVDRVAPQSRGKAIGYFSAAFDLGIGAGSVIMGFVIQAFGFSATFLLCAAIALLALIIFVAKERGNLLRLQTPAQQ